MKCRKRFEISLTRKCDVDVLVPLVLVGVFRNLSLGIEHCPEKVANLFIIMKHERSTYDLDLKRKFPRRNFFDSSRYS